MTGDGSTQAPTSEKDDGEDGLFSGIDWSTAKQYTRRAIPILGAAWVFSKAYSAVEDTVLNPLGLPKFGVSMASKAVGYPVSFAAGAALRVASRAPSTAWTAAKFAGRVGKHLCGSVARAAVED